MALIRRGQDRILFGYVDSENRLSVEDPLMPADACVMLEAGTVGVRQLWSSDSQPIAVLLTDDNRAQVWNLDTCTPLAQFSGHSDPINVVDYDPNREIVVTGDESGLAIQWDSRSGREIARYHSTSWVRTLDIAPDGTKLLMPNWNTASVWDLTYSQEPRQILTDQFNGTHFPHFSPDGQYLYIGGYGIYSRWALDGNQAQHLLTYEQPIRVMDLSSDGRYVYGPLETGEHSTYLIDAETGTTIRRFTGHTKAVNWVDISNDSTKVVGSSFDLTARIWDAATGDLLHVLRGHTGVVSSAMFSPDGSRVVTTSSDGTLRVWDTQTGEQIRIIVIDAPLPFADFSPDGRTLVAADTNGFGHIVDVETGTVLHTLAGHTNTVWTAKFSPDGLLVVTASWDGTTRIWDARTGALLRTLRDGRSTAVYWAEFSPDGETIVVGGDLDDRVYLWRVNLDDVIAEYCSRSPLELTPEQRAQYGIPDDEPVCPIKTRT